MSKDKKTIPVVILEEGEEDTVVGQKSHCYWFVEEGTKVEVKDDEVGFENAWFPGTVLKRPHPLNNPLPGNRTKKMKMVEVEFDHMLAEDESGELLIETVKVTHVRPAPPEYPAAATVEPYDVVDAFHDDVWWTGYVVEVVDDMFRVAFKASDEVFLVGRSELRIHLVWLHHNTWRRPPKEKIKNRMSRELHQTTQIPETSVLNLLALKETADIETEVCNTDNTKAPEGNFSKSTDIETEGCNTDNTKAPEGDCPKSTDIETEGCNTDNTKAPDGDCSKSTESEAPRVSKKSRPNNSSGDLATIWQFMKSTEAFGESVECVSKWLKCKAVDERDRMSQDVTEIVESSTQTRGTVTVVIAERLSRMTKITELASVTADISAKLSRARDLSANLLSDWA